MIYDQLAATTPSPIVELNRAVAISFADRPAAGLAIVDELANLPALEAYHLVPAVRADFLSRLGRRDFDFGEIRMEVVRPGVCEGVRTDLPASIRAWYVHGTAAYIKAALEAAGAREPEVRFRADGRSPLKYD